MINKNQEYIVEILGEGYEGEGVARIENFPIFVAGALLGEEVKIRIPIEIFSNEIKCSGKDCD